MIFQIQKRSKYPKISKDTLSISKYPKVPCIPFQTNVAPHQTSHLLDLHVSSCRSCSEPSRLFQGPRNTKEIKGIIKRYKEIVYSHVMSVSRLSRKWCGISAYIYIRTIHNCEDATLQYIYNKLKQYITRYNKIFNII